MEIDNPGFTVILATFITDIIYSAMDRKPILLCLFLFLSQFAIGQIYSQRFEQALSQRDAVSQKRILTEWKFEWPNSPDLLVGYFNYYKQRYEEESDSLARDGLLSQAFFHIDSGITNFPNRLDMPLLKIAVLGEVGRYEAYTKTTLALLGRHDHIQEEWLWKNGAPLVNATDFLLQYVDNFVVQLYNRQDESLHPYMDEISERVLLSYPAHVPSLSNLAITALYRKDYENGIVHLEKALAVDETNTSVLSNLAYAYEQIGEDETAIKYYEEVVKHGDAQTQDYARKQIEKLKNK